MTLFLKNLLFTVFVPGSVAVAIPLALARGSVPAGGVSRAAAIVLLAAGGAIYGWCLWDFAAFGRGTPAPVDAPKRLVVRGLYRWSRNPMYVGVVTTIAGWAVLFGSRALAIYAVTVALAFNLFIRLYEEPHLQRTFGDEYSAYRAHVGRWFPRLTRSGDGP